MDTPWQLDAARAASDSIYDRKREGQKLGMKEVQRQLERTIRRMSGEKEPSRADRTMGEMGGYWGKEEEEEAERRRRRRIGRRTGRRR